MSKKEGMYILEAGDSRGISKGAEFDVFSDERLSPKSHLGVLVIYRLDTFESEMVIKPPGMPILLTGKAFALPKMTVDEPVRLDLGIDYRTSEVYREFMEGLEKLNEEKQVYLVSERAEATLGMRMEKGEVVLDILDVRVTRYDGVKPRLPAIRLLPADVHRVLRAAARFHWHLNRSSQFSFIEKWVGVEVREVKETNEFDEFLVKRLNIPTNERNLNEGGIATVVADNKTKYGFKIINRSARPFYPYLFFFDNHDLSISE
jgi:hypothetical protein